MNNNIKDAYDTIIKMIDDKINSKNINDLYYIKGLLDALKIITDDSKRLPN